jgi:hypothetical protein
MKFYGIIFYKRFFFKPSTMALAHDKKNNCIEKNYKNTLLMATPLYFFLLEKKLIWPPIECRVTS